MDKKRIISIEGDLYALSILAVSDEDIERLVKARDDDHDFWSGLEDIEDDLAGGAVISGFLIGREASKLHVFVGSEDLSIKLKSALDNHPFTLTSSKFSFHSNSNYLIYEEWFSEGKFIHSLYDDINLSNLRLGIEEQDFPDSSKRQVLNISYGDEDLKFQESTPEDISLYLIRSSGELINLI